MTSMKIMMSETSIITLQSNDKLQVEMFLKVIPSVKIDL